MTRTLWLLVGRGGSKGVPGKNLARIGDRSLVQWKLEVVRQLVDTDDLLVCSTDSNAIADEARAHGALIPFLRPPELATDTASTASVVTHALDALTDVHGLFDRVMLLEPSAPFATTSHYIEAMGTYDANRAHLVAGMKRVEPHTTFIGEQPDDACITPILVRMDRVGRNLRRQDLRHEWTMAGCIYLFGVEMFRKTGSIYGGSRNYGVLIPRWNALEIDSPEDLVLAQFAVEKGYVG